MPWATLWSRYARPIVMRCIANYIHELKSIKITYLGT